MNLSLTKIGYALVATLFLTGCEEIKEEPEPDRSSKRQPAKSADTAKSADASKSADKPAASVVKPAASSSKPAASGDKKAAPAK